MSEMHVRHIMRQIVDIVITLARHQIVHRDIKDENIMINEFSQGTLARNRIDSNLTLAQSLRFESLYLYFKNLPLFTRDQKAKLIDFGCAIEFCDNDVFTSFSGTSEFYPFEWFQHGYYCPLGGAVWSLGCLMFTLLTGLYITLFFLFFTKTQASK